MNHATAPLSAISEVLRTEDEARFLAETAKDCLNCPVCGDRPCDACQAGGVCDMARCSCLDEHWCDDWCDEDPYSDDLDAEGEAT